MTTLTTKPRQRLSKDQQSRLLRLVKNLLGIGKYASEIKQAIADEFHITRRSVERYIARARREMVENIGIPVQEHRAEAFYFYRSIINDPQSTQRERLRARERIDKLLGLDTPVHVHNTLEIEFTPEKLRTMSDEELEATRQQLLKKCGYLDQTAS